MSKKKAKAPKKKPSPEEIQKAKEAAEAKAKKIQEEMEADQAWLDENLDTLSENEKDEIFRQASKRCQGTKREDGRIVLACPLPKKLQYCMDSDPFVGKDGETCASTSQGCGRALSDKASDALNGKDTCIDGGFVSKAEGGSYLSPYVPWGPIAGAEKDGKPRLTTGNSSGVTIGTGVDLGAVQDKEKYLGDLRKAGVSEETLKRLEPLVGKKKADACQALRAAKKDGPLVLPKEDVELIDVHAMKSRVPTLKKQFEAERERRIKSLNAQIKAERKKKKPNQAKIDKWQADIDSTAKFEDLTCAQQTILFSSLYHEGSISKSARPFVKALLAGDDEAARKALVAKTKSKNKLISGRGKRELEYLDDSG